MRKHVILLVLLIPFVSCKPQAVQKGDWVAMHYAITTAAGVRVDSSGCSIFCPGIKPMPFVSKAGEGWLLPGWDEALIGMKKGESKKIQIPPQKSWGNAPPPQGLLSTDTLELTVIITDIQPGDKPFDSSSARD